MTLYLLVFIASAIAVTASGVWLTRCADAIAEATNLGRVWIGTLLLAGATSLPELATDLSAVRLGAVDLAVGDLFGSSMANMLILAVIDLARRDACVLQRATLDHALGAAFAIGLNALGAALVLLGSSATALGWVGPDSLLLLGLYVAGARVVYRHANRNRQVAARPPHTPAAAMPLGRAVRGFALAAAVTLCAAPAFAWSATGIAELTGLGNSFVGTVLVGLSTSLPELVASIAAVRIGAIDLAVGNLFGSNAINMAILFCLDAAQPGNLFASVDPHHGLSGLIAIVLMSLGLAGIVYRAEHRFTMSEPTSALIAVTYLLGVAALFASRP